MKQLAEKNRERVIDLLCERLTFERGGVKLYDAVIAKVHAFGGPPATRVLAELDRQRAEEREHVEWLEGQISALGGDAQGETDLSRLVIEEAKGLEGIVLGGDTDPLHLFHALLQAELTDNVGWEILVELAEEAGDDDARREFRKRLHEEQDHLEFVQGVVEGLVSSQVFAVTARSP
jgi:bacterioferritin (cytochrome b1)